MKYLPTWTKERQQIASWYNEALEGIEEITLPKVREGATHVHHLYVIRTERRDELQQYLKDNGIGTLIHYPIPPHLQEAYKELGYKKGDFPIAEEIAKTALSFPVYIGLSKEDIYTISECIKAFFLK